MLVKGNPTRKISRRDLITDGVAGGIGASLAASVWLGGCQRSSPQDDVSVIVVTLDTTRYDHLGCYGYRRATSPNLDRLAEESVLYSRAISPSSWTLPAHASLFTGKFPSCHGARYDSSGDFRLTQAIQGKKAWNKIRARGLSPADVTLAELLKQRGYATGAVVGGPWLKRLSGLDRGFDYYDDQQISTLNGRRAEQVTTAALGWIDVVRQRPFFLFLNYFDAHGPFQAPGKFGSAFLTEQLVSKDGRPSAEELKARYDGEILYMDHHIGNLVQRLKDWRLYDKSWIIVTADHGELIGEHGKHGHGSYLYQEEVHVPLLMKYPRGEVSPQAIGSPVQLLDILPAICTHRDIPLPADIQGDDPSEIQHPIIAETNPLECISQDGHWKALYQGDQKFVWNSQGRHLLYDLANDPTEQHNLADRRPAHVEQMMLAMNSYLTELPSRVGPEILEDADQETIDALKGLGYLK